MARLPELDARRKLGKRSKGVKGGSYSFLAERAACASPAYWAIVYIEQRHNKARFTLFFSTDIKSLFEKFGSCAIMISERDSS
jgi:hypothetical protein